MSSSLLERLAAHRTLSVVPREQLEWLVRHGTELIIDAGEVLTSSAGPVRGLYVVLDGQLLIRVDRGAGPRIVMEWKGGDVTGVLPYSRIKSPPGDVIAEARTEILAIDPGDLPTMIRECHELTAVLVHVMVDRARVFKSSELLDEKMASLGRLAAGLAHELNNPASAVARSAKMLASEVASLDETTRRFTGLNLTDDQHRAIAALREKRDAPGRDLSPLERSDRQDTLDAWLTAHGITGVDSEPLVALGFRVDDLDQLRALVGSERITAIVAHESATQNVRQLVTEIDTAASRIHSLVAAVKGFTYVNQQSTLMPIAIGQGLADTITVLRSKARSSAVTITSKVDPGLTVEGYGGELNQVWANLLDNAIDATPGGQIRVEAGVHDDKVVVTIIDNGSGIPPEIANRIFDPFFTTKDVGKGTGLGLDIARRIVQRHHGGIDMTTGPSGTEFRVTLPASLSARSS